MHPIQTLCTLLRVSRSGYYDWCARARQPRPRAQANAALAGRLHQLYHQHERVYGSPRLHRLLQAEGRRCGRHRVARLMRQAGLVGRQRRRFRVRTTDSTHGLPIAPNRLLAAAPPPQPDRIWVSDITYVATASGWLYLAAVMDLCSRRIVGWAMANHLEQSLVLAAVRMALASRQPAAGLIIHSDRGSQYAGVAYRRLLVQHGSLASMSRRANCYDNAAMESFWSTLKMECLFRSRFTTHADARQAIFRYIEAFYNPRRLHSALGYRSPLDYESVRN